MSNMVKKKRLKEVTITHVSYVKRGANKRQFFFAKSEAEQANVQMDVKFFSKSDDDEQKLLYGVVYEPNVEDAHGDSMTAEEIEKMAHQFLEYYRNIDTEHNLLAGAGVVVQSYIAPIEFSIGSEVIKKGTWILVTRATDEIWDAWKNGEITGYSMFGISREIEKSKGEQTMKNFIGKVLDKLKIKKDYVEVMEERLTAMTKNPWFIIDIMTDDFYKNIDWAMEPTEVLSELVKSMRSAADYIESSFVNDTVEKSEGTETQESETEPEASVPEETAETEPEGEAMPAEDEENSDNEQEEGEAKKEESPADETEEQSEPEETVAELLEKSMNGISEKIEPILKKIEELEASNKALVEKIEILETGSAAVVENVQKTFHQSKPEISIL